MGIFLTPTTIFVNHSPSLLCNICFGQAVSLVNELSRDQSFLLNSISTVSLIHFPHPQRHHEKEARMRRKLLFMSEITTNSDRFHRRILANHWWPSQCWNYHILLLNNNLSWLSIITLMYQSNYSYIFSVVSRRNSRLCIIHEYFLKYWVQTVVNSL